MAGRIGVRPFLPPARHAAVDERRIACQTVVGTKTEALGNTGPEALHQRVGRLDQTHDGLDALW